MDSNTLFDSAFSWTQLGATLCIAYKGWEGSCFLPSSIGQFIYLSVHAYIRRICTWVTTQHNVVHVAIVFVYAEPSFQKWGRMTRCNKTPGLLIETFSLILSLSKYVQICWRSLSLHPFKIWGLPGMWQIMKAPPSLPWACFICF